MGKLPTLFYTGPTEITTLADGPTGKGQDPSENVNIHAAKQVKEAQYVTCAGANDLVMYPGSQQHSVQYALENMQDRVLVQVTFTDRDHLFVMEGNGCNRRLLSQGFYSKTPGWKDVTWSIDEEEAQAPY